MTEIKPMPNLSNDWRIGKALFHTEYKKEYKNFI